MSIEFGKYVCNEKYGNATMSVTMDPILFKDTFTFGVQESKFDKKKFTVTLCLNDDQQETLKKIREDCLMSLVDQDIAIKGVKSALYNDKVYVNADPELFSTYKEDDEEIEFSEVTKLKNYRVNAAVDVSSVFIKDEIAHLQLYLHELVVLDPKEEKKAKPKRKRVVF